MFRFLQIYGLKMEQKVLKLYVATITGKIFETNSGFHVKQRTTGKVQFLFSRSILLVLTKFSFWEEDWALRYNSMNFDVLIFPNFSRSATPELTRQPRPKSNFKKFRFLFHILLYRKHALGTRLPTRIYHVYY